MGDFRDLENAIIHQQQVVQLTPDGHPEKPLYQHNLGVSFRDLYERLGDVEDLDKSISLLEQAVQLTSNEHPNKPMWLSNLGNSLGNRYARLRDPQDLENAIFHHQQAVQLTVRPIKVQRLRCSPPLSSPLHGVDVMPLNCLPR